ncbi:MAG: hypothetical protein L3J17_06920 [Candidatus Jettenia sp.]|nr:MAG: hypothetical protein L3J17_06920 [Candidatus Jettenia sp.]
MTRKKKIVFGSADFCSSSDDRVCRATLQDCSWARLKPRPTSTPFFHESLLKTA